MQISKAAAEIGGSAMRLVYPLRCPYCDEVLPRYDIACSDCKPKLNKKPLLRIVHNGCPCVSAYPYMDHYADAIKRFKFEGRSGYSEQLAAAIIEALCETDWECAEFVTCVPMYRTRKWARGYNQAELLARSCARMLRLPYIDALKKTGDNPPQHTLIGERVKRENVRNVFRAVNGEALEGRSILIVDDVITTGSTLGECCRILSKYTSLIRCATVCSAAV